METILWDLNFGGCTDHAGVHQCTLQGMENRSLLDECCGDAHSGVECSMAEPMPSILVPICSMVGLSHIIATPGQDHSSHKNAYEIRVLERILFRIWNA